MDKKSFKTYGTSLMMPIGVYSMNFNYVQLGNNS